MRRSFLILALFFITALTTNAQIILEKDVPASVKNKLKEMFSTTEGVSWKQDVPGFVSADFIMDKKRMNATFITSGGWVSTVVYFKKDEIPAEVIAYINSNYSGAKTMTCGFSTSVKEKTYESRIKYNGEAYDIILNEDFSFKMKSKVAY
ncbi:MAG: hypothetical protein LH629_01010 [Ignavibacteria bacterium]|nr:hypothetical protein [Ignavibacteria bacterium]